MCNLTLRPWDDNEVTIEIAARRQEETGDTSQESGVGSQKSEVIG